MSGKQLREIAEAWAYINYRVDQGLLEYGDFEDLEPEEIISLVVYMQNYERTWRF